MNPFKWIGPLTNGRLFSLMRKICLQDSIEEDGPIEEPENVMNNVAWHKGLAMLAAYAWCGEVNLE
ncbi:hypothetical protein HHI36_008798, partial [Cryptolaemus montrouzieri]